MTIEYMGKLSHTQKQRDSVAGTPVTAPPTSDSLFAPPPLLIALAYFEAIPKHYIISSKIFHARFSNSYRLPYCIK
jgi:hypothetical protein